MSIANLKKLQQISHRLNNDKSDIAKQFVSNLKQQLAKRGYRADLAITTDARSTKNTFNAAVRFDVSLGHPNEKDLIALVAAAYPTHEIDWELAQVDSDQGAVLLSLHPASEVIPIKSIKEIPPEFKPIGSGLYKRALDSTGDASEIWTLKKGEDGLVLYRNNDDMEVRAEEGLKAGDVCATPYGPGRVIRFDDLGNAFVQIGSNRRLVAAKDIQKYDQGKELELLKTYYSEAYGDSDFAKSLTTDFGTRKNKKSEK